MSRILKGLASIGLSAVMVAGSLLPASAMPLVKAPAASAAGDIELAQWGGPPGPPGPGWGGPPGPRPGWGGPPGPRPGWGGPPGPRPGWGGPPRQGWYNGHQGYRDRRPGYRYHNGYWFPLAAFAAGAMIGGAMTAPSAPRVAPGGDINPRHYDWCSSRYRSYRSYDNTFQPNYGPRQQCYSPYF